MKPVRIIVPTSPGGLLDLVTRILAQKMTEVTGQNVIVDNRPGASNNIGMELAARAPADGYVVLNATLPLVANPSLFDKLPFNVERDFAPVSQLVAAPYVVVVHPSVPVRSIKELIALARAKPGTLNYSTGGNGTNLHMATELFKNQTGINIVHLAYKGAGPALTALLAGEADLSFPSLGPAMPHIKAQRLRALAITSANRSPLLPDVPTVAESGVRDYTFTSWTGVLVPAATPPAVVTALNAHIVKSMRSPDVVSRLSADGTEVVASSPEQFRALIKSELSRWAAVVKASGMKGGVVENRTGAGGNIGSDAVAKAPPDGYTLLMASPANTINPSLYTKMPYDPMRDLAPIALIASVPTVLLANRSLPVQNVKQLVALAKAQTGRAHLRVGRQRHDGASRRRNVEVARRHRHAARALQRRRAGAHRSSRRPDRAHVRQSGGCSAARQGGQSQSAGRRKRRAVRRVA